MLKDAESEEHWRKYGPGATGVGWDLGFAGLSFHILSGESVPQEEFHAWMVSTEGKQFIRCCATAWGAAHAESGEATAMANEMAVETAKFYCGE